MSMPEPAEIDVPKLLSIVPTYGIEILPPPSQGAAAPVHPSNAPQ